MPLKTGDKRILRREELDILFRALLGEKFRLIGPTVREAAIVYDEIQGVADLPAGWTDEQDGGVYRLKRRNDNALFGYAVGPHSWKKFLFPPVQKLWSADKKKNGFEITEKKPDAGKMAFIGVRSCDLHAIQIQDKVFLKGPFVDPGYQLRRENAFIVSVQCGVAAKTCFCVSMNTGPKAKAGFDLALTEILEPQRHVFYVEVGSEAGARLMEKIPQATVAAAEDGAAADKILETTARNMGRKMDTSGIKELLYRNLDHPRWDEVAKRCLTCANCTMVCPTCFCTTVEDTTDLTGDHAERWRKWDSCFTMDFSAIHGGVVRPTTKLRYRQWMTHKLATWHDQFGSSGCVGCGRCITWCPVAIDLTEETAAIRATETKEKRDATAPS